MIKMGKEMDSFLATKKPISRGFLFLIFIAGMFWGACLMLMVALNGLI